MVFFCRILNSPVQLFIIIQVSEHTHKIEKAQRELEAAIEAAKAETQAAIDKKMTNYEENKNGQLEVK